MPEACWQAAAAPLQLTGAQPVQMAAQVERSAVRFDWHFVRQPEAPWQFVEQVWYIASAVFLQVVAAEVQEARPGQALLVVVVAPVLLEVGLVPPAPPSA